MIGQKQARIADFLKVVDNELSTTFHTMFVTSPFLGVSNVNMMTSTIDNNQGFYLLLLLLSFISLVHVS